jgi:hypothetical protein
MATTAATPAANHQIPHPSSSSSSSNHLGTVSDYLNAFRRSLPRIGSFRPGDGGLLMASFPRLRWTHCGVARHLEAPSRRSCALLALGRHRRRRSSPTMRTWNARPREAPLAHRRPGRAGGGCAGYPSACQVPPEDASIVRLRSEAERTTVSEAEPQTPRFAQNPGLGPAHGHRRIDVQTPPPPPEGSCR